MLRKITNPFAKILVIRWVVAVEEWYVVQEGFLVGDRLGDGFQIIKKGQRDESTQDQQ